jgi:hypothetical protein
MVATYADFNLLTPLSIADVLGPYDVQMFALTVYALYLTDILS